VGEIAETEHSPNRTVIADQKYLPSGFEAGLCTCSSCLVAAGRHGGDACRAGELGASQPVLTTAVSHRQTLMVGWWAQGHAAPRNTSQGARHQPWVQSKGTIGACSLEGSFLLCSRAERERLPHAMCRATGPGSSAGLPSPPCSPALTGLPVPSSLWAVTLPGARQIHANKAAYQLPNKPRCSPACRSLCDGSSRVWGGRRGGPCIAPMVQLRLMLTRSDSSSLLLFAVYKVCEGRFFSQVLRNKAALLLQNYSDMVIQTRLLRRRLETGLG